MHWLMLLVLAFGPAMSAERIRAINRLNEGIKAEAKHDTATALRLLEEAVQLDEGFARAHYTLGQLYLKDARYVDAAGAFKAGSKVVADGDDLAGQISYQLGVAIGGQSEASDLSVERRKALKREEIEALGQAIERDPSHYKAHLLRARAYDRLEDPDAADADFRQCIWLRPQHSPCFVGMAAMYIDYGFATEAIAVLEAGLKVNEMDAEMWSGTGRAYFDLGRPRDAVDAFKKAKAIDPDMIEVLYGLGMAYAELRLRAEAIEHLEFFVQRAGDDVPQDRVRAANNTIARMQDVF